MMSNVFSAQCSAVYLTGALLGQFIYTRRQTESSVNYIHDIRHYNYPKYNSQLVALQPLADTARINNAQRSNVNQQCESEACFNESWHQKQSMHHWTTELTCELTQCRDDITFSNITPFWTCNCRESSEILHPQHTVGALERQICVIAFFVQRGFPLPFTFQWDGTSFSCILF